MSQDSISTSGELHRQILDFCRHAAGSAQITAISMFDNCSMGISSLKATLEVVLVIRDFQPRLISYVKVVDGRNIIVVAVDQWIFERDVERGFLGESLASTLIFPHVALDGRDYLHTQEILLKKRLILELIENLVLSFPELSYRIYIKPQYFMYEAMLNRVRVFPPLAYGISNFMNGVTLNDEVDSVLQGYKEALEQLEKEKKISLSEGYAMIPKQTSSGKQKAKSSFYKHFKKCTKNHIHFIVRSFPAIIELFFAEH